MLFIGLSACGSDDDDNMASSADAAGTPMKVMSYNIRYSNTIDLGDTSWDSRRQPSIDMIRDENPDIIGLQEPRADQREDLAGDLVDVYTMYSAVDNGVPTTEPVIRQSCIVPTVLLCSTKAISG